MNRRSCPRWAAGSRSSRWARSYSLGVYSQPVRRPLPQTCAMAELVVMATLDGGGAPFRIAATERGIAAAGWDPDEDAVQTDRAKRFHAPVVSIADARPDAPAAIVLRAA